MFSAIQKAYEDVVNSELWNNPVKPFLKLGVFSGACGTLAHRMWITANQLTEDEYAREQTFRAGQRLFALMADQREAAINGFAMTNRVGALVLGVSSITLAIKAITTIWNHNELETR